MRRKALIVVAAQEDGLGIGRIRMRRIPDAPAASLHPFAREAIEPGCVVHRDGWQGYGGVGRYGYVHEVTLRKAGPPICCPVSTGWWRCSNGG